MISTADISVKIGRLGTRTISRLISNTESNNCKLSKLSVSFAHLRRGSGLSTIVEPVKAVLNGKLGAIVLRDSSLATVSKTCIYKPMRGALEMVLRELNYELTSYEGESPEGRFPELVVDPSETKLNNRTTQYLPHHMDSISTGLRENKPCDLVILGGLSADPFNQVYNSIVNLRVTLNTFKVIAPKQYQCLMNSKYKFSLPYSIAVRDSFPAITAPFYTKDRLNFTIEMEGTTKEEKEALKLFNECILACKSRQIVTIEPAELLIINNSWFSHDRWVEFPDKPSQRSVARGRAVPIKDATTIAIASSRA